MSKQSGSGTAMNKKRRAKPCRSVRKARTRKPKFLSLRLQLAGDKSGDGGPLAAELQDCKTTQLNLFPLHPENLTEEKDAAAAAQEENYVAAEYNFFSAAESGATTLTGLLGATTLTGLLGAPSTSASSWEDYRSGGGNKAFSSSDSLRYTYGCRGAALARTALRSKERKPCEEKWVCYSEVVENERKDEEVTSSSSDLLRRVSDTRRRLSLKLDYEEIITAWSNRGSLYIQPECPQTVPDIIHDDFFSGGFFEPSSSHGTRGGGWERNLSLYTVPEMVGSSGGKCQNNGEKPPAQDGGDEEGAAGQTHRAASVLRYKEKRHNRLFSKTIRYQVRKLNAEKRPRVKGRFVKRD